MMSSFRPDPDYRARGFVPTASPGVHATGGGAEFKATQAAPASELGATDATTAQAPAVESPAAGETLSIEEVERLEHEAFERGVASARKATDALEHACATLEASAGALRAFGTAAITANRELMLDLASEIARRWVGAELALDRELLTRVLDRALETCSEQTPTRLLLHPEDHAALLEQAEERIDSWRERHALDLVDDPDLARGEFRIDAKHGFVDGRGERVLSRLRESLSEALAQTTEGAEQ